VSHRQTSSSLSRTKGCSLRLQPAPAWAAILALASFTLLCILAGAGKILNLVFPVAALAVAIRLYFSYPILYIGFSWWILFLTPLIRRLADYRSSYTEPSPLLLAPYLVICVTLVTVWQHLPTIHRQGGLPFVLSLVGIFYGFLIGLINLPLFSVVRAVLDWLAPVSFSFHLFANWRDYPSYRQNIYRVFIWGTLVMGVYGVFQYVVAPEWDRLWLIESGMSSSQGSPQPFGMRVWSTMNSVEPFGAVMAAFLLLLFTSQGTLTISASVVGYLSFLLSTVRSAWVGWLVGLLALGGSLKSKYQMRSISTVLVIALLALPVTTIEPFSKTINDRLSTFSNLEEDGSARVRKQNFEYQIGSALTNFTGDGIGGSFHDNTILALLLNLGWFGTIFYMGGLLLLVAKLFQSSTGNFDPFTSATRAIVVSALVRIPVNAPIAGVSGVVLWGFLGLGLVANKYYQHQRVAELAFSSPDREKDTGSANR
jgi:hypothetical protein